MMKARKSKRFKFPKQRSAYFRALDYRTDRKARRNRELIERDRERLEAGLSSLPSPPMGEGAQR
jgi:hypothetical protein